MDCYGGGALKYAKEKFVLLRPHESAKSVGVETKYVTFSTFGGAPLHSDGRFPQLADLNCESAIYLCTRGSTHKPACQWVMCHGSHIPANAVPGGEAGWETLFVGRAVHDGDVIPGKVVLSHSCCYVSYYGGEHTHRDYQVLTCDGPPLAWVAASHGSVPTGAIQGGRTRTGEPLYIGRASHEGTLTIGKVHPSHKCLYLPYRGGEHRYTDYEVLVCKTINF